MMHLYDFVQLVPKTLQLIAVNHAQNRMGQTKFVENVFWFNPALVFTSIGNVQNIILR